MKKHLLSALLALSIALPASAAERTRHFTFMAPPQRVRVAHDLAHGAEKMLEDVALKLGVGDLEQEPIMVRIFANEEALSKAMPHSSITEWAAGIAFPRSSLILLKVDHSTMFNVHDVFRHEVSHIVLGRAVNHQRMPMWFVEGVAVLQAGERVRDRWAQTATASLTGSIPPMATITDSFPGDSTRVDLAYAQSTAFVTWLVNRRGWSGIRRLLAGVRAGKTFEQSFQKVYRSPVVTLEAQWQRDIRNSTSWFTLFTDSSLLWMIAIVLFFFAWLTVRARNIRALSKMDEPGLDDEFA